MNPRCSVGNMRPTSAWCDVSPQPSAIEPRQRITTSSQMHSLTGTTPGSRRKAGGALAGGLRDTHLYPRPRLPGGFDRGR
jgi:hypothetical protein